MKKLNKVLLILFIAVAAFLLIQPEAEASGKVVFKNHRNQKVAIALIYYDIQEGSWCCQGWWNVKPNTRRTIHIPFSPRKRIYYYVEAKGRPVYKRSEGWARWDIINNSFKYYKMDGCPHGKNFRSAYFNCSSTVAGKSWTLNLN